MKIPDVSYMPVFLSQHRESEQLREMGIKKERTLTSGQRKDIEKPEANVLYG